LPGKYFSGIFVGGGAHAPPALRLLRLCYSAELKDGTLYVLDAKPKESTIAMPSIRRYYQVAVSWLGMTTIQFCAFAYKVATAHWKCWANCRLY